MNYEPGQICTVNGNCDLMQDKDKGAFMYRKCVIVKRCKSGLLLLRLANDRRVQNSFAEYNIDPWNNVTIDRLRKAFGGSRGPMSEEARAELEAEWARIKIEEADVVNEQRSQSEHDEEDLK